MLLFVAARSRLDRYEELCRHFEDWRNVRIVLGRREGDQRPKPSKLKAKLPVAPKSLRDEEATVRDLEKRLAEALKRESEAQGQLQIRDRELVETHEHQTATADILRVISGSPSDIQPVFDTIADHA